MTAVAEIQSIFSVLSGGDPGAAERRCRDALQVQPRDADVLLLLALSLHQQGRLAEAVDVYAQLTRICPDAGTHWSNYATALRELAGQQESPEATLRASVEAYATALQLDPDNADTLVNYGLLLLQQHDFQQARRIFLDAHLLEPESPRTRIHAARACSVCQDPQADALLKPWRQWTTLNDALQLELASVLAALSDADAAELVLTELLRRRPGHLQAEIELAALYERMNRVADAAALLQKIAAAHAVLDDAAQSAIARLRAVLAVRQGDLVAARSLLEGATSRAVVDYADYFLLAEVYDKLDDRDAAVQALRVGHARQIVDIKLVAPDHFAPGAPILPSAVTRITPRQYGGWPTLQAPEARQSPVFIVGFPRSGTTLLEQMLDAHAGMQSMDERPFFNILSDELAAFDVRVPQDLDKLGQHDCDELRSRYWGLVCDKIQRDWQTQMVDKNPLNMLWLPMIHRLFPQAKIILALRHPCDVILSCYMQHFHSHVLAVACASFEQLATAYVTAMECWLHHVDVFQPDVLVSRYENLVTDFASETQRIADFIGIEDTAALLKFDEHARRKSFIGTPSYTQVIQPVNRKGLNRWSRYRREIEPVLPVLEPMLRRWNYAV